MAMAAVKAIESTGGVNGDIPISTQPKLLDRMIYTQVLNRGGKGVRSPADVLREESYTDQHKMPGEDLEIAGTHGKEIAYVDRQS